MTKYDVARIVALNDERFKELLTKHLGGREGDPELWMALLGTELIDRTGDLLKSMFETAQASAAQQENRRNEIRLACLERGPAGRTEWLHEDAKYQLWSSRNKNFKKMVQARLSELREARHTHVLEGRRVRRDTKGSRLEIHADRLTKQSAEYRDAIRQLTKRIHQHQALTAASGREPEQHDYDLWQLLDLLTVPIGAEQQDVTLRDMMRAYWFETTPATVAEGQRGQAERMMRQAPAGRSPRYEGVPKARRVGEPKRLA